MLADPPNVLAANHLQQAAEKIISAVRLHRGLLNTKDHDLVILIDATPAVSHGRFPKAIRCATDAGHMLGWKLDDGLQIRPQPLGHAPRRC